MGTYHFALPTRRHLALHIGANEQEQGRKSLFAFYRFLKLGIFYLVVSEGEREVCVPKLCVYPLATTCSVRSLSWDHIGRLDDDDGEREEWSDLLVLVSILTLSQLF